MDTWLLLGLHLVSSSEDNPLSVTYLPLSVPGVQIPNFLPFLFHLAKRIIHVVLS